MHYESLMLTKNQFENYEFYEALSKLPKKKYLTRDLSTVMGWNANKVKYALERVSEILAEAHPEQAALFTDKYLDLTQLTISLSRFRYLLLKDHSLAFQFLLWILMKEDASMESFLEAHFVSQSTLNRAVRGLQKYLKTYQIQISLTNFQIESKDELMLRQSLFYLLWLGTKGETEVFEPYELDETHLQRILVQVPPSQRYIMGKLYRLKLIIQYFRTKKGHFMTQNPRLDHFFADDDFDLDFQKGTPWLPEKDRLLESQSLLANLVTSPLFVEDDRPKLEKQQRLLTKFAPDLSSFANLFLSYFEEEIFKGPIPESQRQVLWINLTQAAVGIWVYGGTFPNLHYFLVQESDSPANLQYEFEIKTFFQSEHVQPYLEYRSLFSTYEKSFGHILQPYYVEVMPWTHLLVGIAIEPNSILQDKIKLVLDSIYFVNAEFFQIEKAEEYDMVISSVGSFSEDFPNVPHIVWNIAEEDEDLPFLFYHLRDMFYQKTSKLRFI